jgi:hypothetical protein
MLCLTGMPNQIFCRLSTWSRLRFTCSPTSFRRSSKDLWILDGIIWWWLFELNSIIVAGCTLTVLKMPSRSFGTYSFFRWPIFAATFYDPWLIILINFDLIKQPCASFWCRGWTTPPFQKKKKSRQGEEEWIQCCPSRVVGCSSAGACLPTDHRPLVHGRTIHPQVRSCLTCDFAEVAEQCPLVCIRASLSSYVRDYVHAYTRGPLRRP